MTTTAAALRHPGVRSAATPLVTLGPRQFVVLVVCLLLYGLLYIILLAPFITRAISNGRRCRPTSRRSASAWAWSTRARSRTGTSSRSHPAAVSPRPGFRAGDFPIGAPRKRHRHAALGSRRGGCGPSRLRDGAGTRTRSSRGARSASRHRDVAPDTSSSCRMTRRRFLRGGLASVAVLGGAAAYARYWSVSMSKSPASSWRSGSRGRYASPCSATSTWIRSSRWATSSASSAMVNALRARPDPSYRRLRVAYRRSRRRARSCAGAG